LRLDSDDYSTAVACSGGLRCAFSSSYFCFFVFCVLHLSVFVTNKHQHQRFSK